MSKAIGKTCGGTLPNHVPSSLDGNGDGHPDHKVPMTPFQAIDPYPAPAPSLMPLTNQDEELRRQVAELTIKLSEELRANTVDEILRSAKPMRNAYLEIVDLIKQRDKDLSQEAMVYMTPGRAQDYRNRLSASFKNDPRVTQEFKEKE